MKSILVYSLLALGLSGCAAPTTTILLPDRYLEDCHETAPLTVQEYLALDTFEKKEISLFSQNNLLRDDIHECNARLKAARHIQNEAKKRIKK